MTASSQVALIAGGVAVIVLASLWRLAFRHHQVSRLKRQLDCADQPIERARAGNELIELGLRRAARPILRTMLREPDERVRRSIALAVARRQWEPSGPERAARVRRWAADELGALGQPVTEFGPAVTRLSDMGGPRSPAPNGAPAPSPAPTPFTPGEDTVTEPSVPSVARTDGGISWVAPASSSRPGT